MRHFVSVALDGLEDGIAAVQESLADASGIRLTDPHRVHVTLKFLGDVDGSCVPDLTDALEAAVEEADVEPFTAEFGGLGAFPSTDYIRVVWVGIQEGSDDLTRLHEAIERKTVELGFDPADHAFTPHATVARMDHAGGKERVQRVLRETDSTVGSREVDSIDLTESVLTDDGPEYTTVERFEL